MPVKWLPFKKVKGIQGQGGHVLKPSELQMVMCPCKSPCTTSKLGYSHNVPLEHNLRDNPIIPGDSEQWQNIAGSRHIAEQVISRLKLSLNLSRSYVQLLKSIKSTNIAKKL